VRVPWPWCPHAAAAGQAPPDYGRVRIETICRFRCERCVGGSRDTFTIHILSLSLQQGGALVGRRRSRDVEAVRRACSL
jgi:hypothetical protein